MPQFEIVSDFKITGDQPQAVEKLVEGLKRAFGADATRSYRQR